MNHSTEPIVKRDIVAMHNFVAQMPSQTISAKALLDQFMVPEKTQEEIRERFTRSKLFNENFRFVPAEFVKFVSFRTVELDNGALLTAPTGRFDQVFRTETLKAAHGMLRFSTEGTVVGQRFRKAKP